MELIDRYLQAVRFWLPREQRDDITRELADDLRGEIEDQQHSLGRPLTEPDIEAILKRRGRPFVVASRYLPQRQLVGPLLFPMYAFVLKLIGLAFVLPWVLVWIAELTFAPSYRDHVGRDVLSLWLMAMQIFAVVTIAFAAQEHFFGTSNRLADWEPSDLPRLHVSNERVSRAGAVMEIVINLAFLMWWSGGFTMPYAITWNTGSVWSEFHHTYFYTVIGLTFLIIANAAVSLGRPDWARPRLLVRAFGSAVAALIAGSTVLTQWQPVIAAFRRAAKLPAPAAHSWAIGAIMDGTTLITLAIIAIASVISAIVEIYRATASSTYGTMSKLRT